MEKTKKYTILIILLFTLVSLTQTIKAEEKEITLEFFYKDGCHSCGHAKPIINETELKYDEYVNVIRIIVKNNLSENYIYFNQTYGFTYVPAVVIRNDTDQFLFNHSNINKNNLETTIEAMLPEIGSDPQPNKNDTEPQPNEGELNTYLLVIVIIAFPIILLLILLLNKRKL